MKTYLIINADDFGLNTAVNQGIISAFQQGVVTSTSLLTNGQAWDDALSKIKANPDLDLGVHLNVLRGQPLTKLKYLVSDDNLLNPNLLNLIFKSYLYRRQIAREIYQEFEAQIKKALAAGLNITHLDTEKHIHTLPFISKILINLAKQYNIKYIRCPFEKMFLTKLKLSQLFKIVVSELFFSRTEKMLKQSSLNCPDFFYGVSLSGSYSVKNLKKFIDRLKPGVSELSCHPGLESKTEKSYIDKYRQEELKVLTDHDFLEYINNKAVILTNFNILNNPYAIQ